MVPGPKLILTNSRQSYYTRSDLPGVLNWSVYMLQSKTAKGEDRTYQNNKGWQEKVHRGEDAGSSYTRRIIKVHQQPRLRATTFGTEIIGDKRVNFSGWCTDQRWVDPFNSLDDLIEDQSLKDLALKRLKRRMEGRSKRVNVMAPIAELRELRGLVVALAYSSVDLLHALISIKRTKGKSAAQFAAHAWLTWSFAVRPTISEINEIAASVQDYLTEHEDETFVEHGSATSQWEDSLTIATEAPLYGLWTGKNRLQRARYHQLGYRYTCGFRPAIAAANNYGVGEHFGLSFGQMVPAAWELTPFSWMFDYFGTVGEWLEDVFQTSSDPTIYVCLNRRYTVTLVDQWDLTPQSGYILEYQQNRPGRTTITHFSRTPLSALPTRSLRFKSLGEIAPIVRSKEDGEASYSGIVGKVLNLASILVGGKAVSSHF